MTELEQYRRSALIEIKKNFERIKQTAIRALEEYGRVVKIKPIGSITDASRFNEDSDVDIGIWIETNDYESGMNEKLSEKAQQAFLSLFLDYCGILNTVVYVKNSKITEKTITKAQLDTLERVVDKVFANIGIDVEFTRHFLDRVNDERNRKQITIRELGELFAKEYRRWGREIARMPVDTQAVMKDLSSELNIPFVLNPDGKEKDLVAKTVMRKKNFRTPNKELPVESVNESGRHRDYTPRKSTSRSITINGVEIPLKKESWGDWVVPYGKFKNIGTFKKKSELVAALRQKVADRVEEKHGAQRGKQVKGRSATPKKTKPSKSGQQPHPMRGKLVGEEQINEVGGGKVVATVNGYPIHDMGAAYPHKDKRFLIRDPNIDVWQASAPTLKAAGAKANELKPAVKQASKTQAQIDHDDWRDEQRAKIATGEIRRAVRSRRGLGEEQFSEERSEICCEGKLGEYDVYVEYYPRNHMYMVDIPEANMPAFRREYGRIDLTQEFGTPEDAMEHIERETYNEVEWTFTKSSLDEFMDEPPLDAPTLDVDAVANKHGVDRDKIEQQLKMGIEVEMEHTTNALAAREIALDHLMELPDYYDKLATIEPHHFTPESVRAAWESYQVDERIRDPREAMLDMALKVLDRKVKNDRDRQSLGGLAMDVAHEVKLNQIGVNHRDLAQLYRDWKGDTVVSEGWIEDNLYYLDEVINTESAYAGPTRKQVIQYAKDKKAEKEWYAKYKAEKDAEYDAWVKAGRPKKKKK